ncbi:hypothetical protein CDAR_248751, partial [Caerostris darwini]
KAAKPTEETALTKAKTFVNTLIKLLRHPHKKKPTRLIHPNEKRTHAKPSLP